VKVAFDSRPTAEERGLGRYSRCLLQALRDTAGEQDEILEAHHPRGAEVFHTPWMQGAMLHSPCPMVVTLHDLAALKRPSERLRSGGIHLRLRHLAVQRASHVIVPNEALAGEAAVELGLEHERVIVIPEASEPPADTAHRPVHAQPTWTWEDAARETWGVYRRALTQPHRPCVTGPKARQLRRPRTGRSIFDRTDQARGL
jgi:Glycosyltransferase Family 4